MAAESIRVLVVDDSEFFAQMTAETLTEEHGMEAVAEHSGTAALSRLADGEFDCVVSDYEMPEMDGLSLLRAIREDDPTLPFILLTGRGDEETASAAIAAGVADYLLKLEVVEDKQYGRLANRIESVVGQDRTRRKFESLVENSPDGIAQVATDGTILSANRAMADRLGRDPDSLVGEHLTDVMDAEPAQRRVAAVRRAVETGETEELEDSVDGRHYQTQFVPVESHRQRDTVQLVERDVTERVARQRELERQNERLEEFASVVSHDLRNPLNVAQSAMELLERPDDETEADLLAKVDRSLTRMGEIIEDVLTLAREGRTVDDPQRVTVEALATDAWAWVETGDATLSVTTDATILADTKRAHDLFTNLFRNAVEHGSTSNRTQSDDATEHDDPVAVEVGSLPGGFYVEDDGVGIDASGDVFEMGESSGEGTGIGLAIVWQVARAHGWSVELAESERGGARFEFTGVEPAD
ncbi:response regulator [Halomicroarcula limicola]|uniref:histidine kinase n=1 Tax=Haloarcula limicola TaxID=1429915 RepID=A0A8J7Y7M1_9EURY|nr:response regulator [Halomicroarcula limicola]MBV0923178.1 response regulator [Halomicroarcula limicola]